MRSMVEGSTLATIHYEPQSCIQIFQDIARSNSQRVEADLGQFSIPAFIMLRPITHVVRFTVDFDRQTTIKTGEV